MLFVSVLLMNPFIFVFNITRPGKSYFDAQSRSVPKQSTTGLSNQDRLQFHFSKPQFIYMILIYLQ